jgi:uncharacterized circularly permuted ATP-grasp superfamily protein
MVPSDPHAAVAAKTFKRLLEEDPSGTREEYAAVRDEFRRNHLLVGDDIAPFSFMPALISKSRLQAVQKDVAKLMRILRRLEPMLLRPRWLNALGISHEEQDLIRLPAGFDLGIHVSRVDGFLGPQSEGDTGFRVIELNVDSPGGVAYHDAASRIFLQTPTWSRFRKAHPGRCQPGGKRILSLLLRAWKQWGGMGKPRIGIVDWVTVSTASEFDVLRAQFLKAGVETVVADPRELEYSGGRLRDYDGKPLDIVYRRVLVEDLLARGHEARALVDAYRAGAVCVVNPFRCKPLTVKSLMAIFHQPDMKELVSPSDMAFLRRIIPWTAIVEEGPVMERLERDQKKLILKPADGWGGAGLYLGWDLSPSEWSEAMEEAVKARYIAQERVHIPSAEFPVAAESGWSFHDFRLDFNPYTFSTGVGTPLIRLSTSDVLNIKTGGQLSVTYVLED